MNCFIYIYDERKSWKTKPIVYNPLGTSEEYSSLYDCVYIIYNGVNQSMLKNSVEGIDYRWFFWGFKGVMQRDE